MSRAKRSGTVTGDRAGAGRAAETDDGAAVPVLLRLAEDDLAIDEAAVRRGRGVVRFRVERDSAVDRSAILELHAREALRRTSDAARRERVRDVRVGVRLPVERPAVAGIATSAGRNRDRP